MSSCQKAELSEHDGAHPLTPGPRRPTRERLVWPLIEEFCPPWPNTCSLLGGREGQRYAGYTALLAK